MELDASNIIFIASLALIVGIAALVIYKVRVRGDDIQEKTLHRIGNMLTAVVVAPILLAFRIELDLDSWTTQLGLVAVVVAVGSLFHWVLGRK